jgi:hypothetical protein
MQQAFSLSDPPGQPQKTAIYRNLSEELTASTWLDYKGAE